MNYRMKVRFRLSYHSLVLTQAADTAYFLNLLSPLLSTYPRYQDRKSRKAVQQVVLACIRNHTTSEGACKRITTFLSQESQKAIIAPTNAYVLLEWCSLLQQAVPIDTIYLGK